jgi:hypothetical protein
MVKLDCARLDWLLNFDAQRRADQIPGRLAVIETMPHRLRYALGTTPKTT